ncbi:MAG: type IX secretion system membrane protein PorP/SprF [Brumimicrobium sp.]|nr:type IX secretion system membrane protein PorP/SprF [Brumimicrobium sp.]
MKQSILHSIFWLLISFQIGIAQRNMDDLFFIQGSNYYNAAYAPTHTDSTDFKAAVDTRTFLRYVPNNIGQIVVPNLTYQAFVKMQNVTLTYNYNLQPLTFTKNNELGLGFIYTIPFTTQHKLSFGVRGSFGIYNLKRFNEIGFIDIEKSKKWTMLGDFDLGIHYFIKRFELGISTKNILASKYAPDDILFRTDREIYLQLAYNFLLGKRKNYSLKISVFTAPLYWLNSYLSFNLGIYKKAYFQFTISAKDISNQFSFGYDFRIGENPLSLGLAFTQSLIAKNYNFGLRIAYKF